MHDTFLQTQLGRLVLMNIEQAQCGFLAETQYDLIGQLDGSAATFTSGDLIPRAQGLLQARFVPDASGCLSRRTYFYNTF